MTDVLAAVAETVVIMGGAVSGGLGVIKVKSLDTEPLPAASLEVTSFRI
ncbi:MAG: hypothetical protein Q8O16_00900 [Dehalococcoidia bacterium]|nr:hypothetical protein [Dehalococcoidia bacterium]